MAIEPHSFPEWLKILLTALSAFAFGTISEPLKIWINRNSKLSSMRTSLYAELGSNYLLLSDFLRDRPETTKGFYMHMAVKGFPSSAYKWAVSQADVFYLLPEAHAFNAVYNTLLWAFSDNGRHALDEETLGLEVMDAFEREISAGSLNAAMFEKINPAVAKLTREVRRGERPAARKVARSSRK